MELSDVLMQAGVTLAPEGHHHTRPGWINFDCPYCGKVNKYHMGYNKARKYLHCWQCGPQRIIKTLIALGIDPKQAKQVYDGLDVEIEVKQRIQGTLQLPKRILPLSKAHKQYLRQRGFKPQEIVKLWGVQGIPQAAKLSWRLFIPIYWRGQLVSWTTRSIQKSATSRYISAAPTEEAIPHKNILYGADYTTHAVIIHEGPLDVWATGPGSVATFGLRLTPSQVNLLSAYPLRVVCFDSSRQAQERAKEVCDSLSAFRGETINVQLETGSDPADADPGELQELRHAFL